MNIGLAFTEMAPDRCIDDRGQTLPGEVVDRGEHPEAPTPGQCIGDEVQ